MSLILLDFWGRQSGIWAMSSPSNRSQDQRPAHARLAGTDAAKDSAAELGSQLSPITARDARYIKLGKRGSYEDTCLDQGILRLGFYDISHEAALKDDTEKMKTHAAVRHSSPSKRTDIVRQVSDFYQLGGDVLWITFVNGRLYWCFAEKGVEWVETPPDGAVKPYRIRRCKTAWRDSDINGAPLYISELSGKFTKVASYQSSLCRVKEFEYLIRKINGQEIPEVAEARKLKPQILDTIIALMRLLDPRDFELLVELIFSNSGWRRTGVLGGPQKTVDLELTLPSTGEHAFVQVKSQTRQAEFKNYLRRFERRAETRMFYAYHTAKRPLTAPDQGCVLLGPERLAEMVLDAGLYDWLIEKAD